MALCILFAAGNSAFAGDLGLYCYQNGDWGDVVGDHTTFMDTNNITHIVEHKEYVYTVLTSRESLFENYQYEVTKTNSDGTSERSYYKTQKYDQPVRVGDDLDCIVTD